MQQLMMLWSQQLIPEAAPPEGFELRTYRDGDAMGWIEACKGGELGTELMAEEDFRKQMLNAEGIYPEGIFLVVAGSGEIAGTATGVLKPEPEMGYLHMVGVKPKYRGRGLAKVLNTAVLKYLVTHGCKKVTLHTDDFRIPAIKSYLTLGFRPILYTEDMLSRWQKVLRDVEYEKIDTYTSDGKPGSVVSASI